MEQNAIENNKQPSDIQPKMHFTGKVIMTNLAGALVDIGKEKPALLHVSRISIEGAQPIKKVEDVLQIGKEIDVWVKRVVGDRVELTMFKPLTYEWRDLQADMVVKGTIVKFEKFGAFIEIGAERPALVHISEMAHGYVKRPEDILKQGDEIEAKIIDVDRKKRQIKLSIKALLPEPEVEEIVFDNPNRKSPIRNKKQSHREKFEGKGEETTSTSSGEESALPDPTYMELALRQAMDKRKNKEERIKKAKQISREQEEIFSRTLENKVQTK